MLEKSTKSSVALIPILCIGLVCLTQMTCHTNSSQNRPTFTQSKTVSSQQEKDMGSSTTGFKLELEEPLNEKAPKNNYFNVIIVSNKEGIDLKDLHVEGSVVPQTQEGKLKVEKNKKGSFRKLNNESLDKLYITSKEGKRVTFRLMYEPQNATSGTEYTLLVKMTHKDHGEQKKELKFKVK